MFNQTVSGGSCGQRTPLLDLLGGLGACWQEIPTEVGYLKSRAIFCCLNSHISRQLIGSGTAEIWMGTLRYSASITNSSLAHMPAQLPQILIFLSPKPNLSLNFIFIIYFKCVCLHIFFQDRIILQYWVLAYCFSVIFHSLLLFKWILATFILLYFIMSGS